MDLYERNKEALSAYNDQKFLDNCVDKIATRVAICFSFGYSSETAVRTALAELARDGIVLKDVG